MANIELDQLSAAVHRALKHHRSRKPFDPGPLAGLKAVKKYLREMKLAADEAGFSQAIHAALSQALADLAAAQPEAAQLLERRFVKGESVTALSLALSIAPNTLHYRQSQAVGLLAAQLLKIEEAQVEAKPPVPAGPSVAEPGAMGAELPWELPPSTYSCLFGTEEKQKHLADALCRDDGPALAVIDGMGGMGKTTLARAVAERCAGRFNALLWLTARREAEYDTWQGKRRDLGRPALTAESMLDAIAIRLGLREMIQQSAAHKHALLAPHLSRIRALIVIDNLETAQDGETVVQTVRQLERPTRFLITSRFRLPAELAIHLDDLPLPDSLALLRHEAGLRGLDEMKQANDAALEPIYKVVGGNPLALKLVVGQVTHLPLKRVLDALRQVQRVPGSAEMELYGYLYQQTWGLLSAPARELLLTMPVLPIVGSTWDDLLALSGLDEQTLDQAIAELVRFSLLSVGGWPDRVYSIHRLTFNFLMSEVMKWW